MRKFLYLVLFFIAINISSKAQIIQVDTVKSTFIYKKPNNNQLGKTEYKYAVGLKILSIEQFPKILNQTNSTNYTSSLLNGFLIKLNDNQISYRIGGSFYNDKISFKNECEDCEVVKGELNDLSLKLGFEKNINYSTIQPYFGTDLIFRRNKFEGIATNTGTVNYNVVAEKTSGGLGPVIGIKFNVIQHFTLGVESGIDILYTYERQNKSYPDAQNTHTFQKFNKLELLFKPVAFLSLQYNFGLSD